MLSRTSAVGKSAGLRLSTQELVTLYHLLAVNAEAVTADLEQFENDRVQCLQTAIALEDVLVPHQEWASLILNVRLCNKHLRHHRVRNLLTVHLVPTRLISRAEIDRRVRKHTANVLVLEIAEVKPWLKGSISNLPLIF